MIDGCRAVGLIQATQLKLIQSLYTIGVLSFNHSNSSDVQTREFLFATMGVLSSAVKWVGPGFEDGASLFWYNENASGFTIPPTHNGQALSPFMYEFGNPKMYCPEMDTFLTSTPERNNSGLVTMVADTTGKPGVKVACWGDYDPRKRVWYTAAKANGSQWVTEPYTWLGTPAISVSMNLADARGQFIGVTTAAMEFTALEAQLKATVGSNLAYVIERSGNHQLVFASESGVSWDYGSSSQVPALNSSVDKIRITATELIRYGLPDENMTYPFVTDDTMYFVFATSVSELGGLPLSNDWVVVMVQDTNCDPSFYVEPKLAFTCQACIAPAASLGGGAMTCDLCEKNFFESDGGCKVCPEGAEW